MEDLLSNHSLEYKESLKSESIEPLDSVVFNLVKFIRLAADSNPNILDILFAHRDDWIFSHPIWEKLYEKRHNFLSMKVRHTYTGYAMSQLKRIKMHRKWLLEPFKDKPTRKEYHLPENHSLVPKDIEDLAESFIRKKQEEWQLDTLMEYLPEDQRDDVRLQLLGYFEMVHGRPYQSNEWHEREQAALQAGISEELYIRLDAERRYKQALNQWKSYQRWLKERNKKRAALEKEFGYDSKHASHLVRLLLSAQEILTEGTLSVRHPHAELLRKVRAGAWSYDELIDWASNQEKIINELASKKPLRHSVDGHFIDQFAKELVLEFYGKN